MPNRTILLRLLVLALAAEMLASLWRLLTFPSDTYIGVGNYELGRMLYWLPLIGLALVFVSSFEAKFQMLQASEKTRKLFLHFVALAALALCVETLTSLGYWWRSPHSGPVRALYESVWYWERVPRPSDYGWRSFAGYFVDHLKPWTAVMLFGLGAWYLRTKKAPPVC
jgi:hypothetical protein